MKFLFHHAHFQYVDSFMSPFILHKPLLFSYISCLILLFALNKTALQLFCHMVHKTMIYIAYPIV